LLAPLPEKQSGRDEIRERANDAIAGGSRNHVDSNMRREVLGKKSLLLQSGLRLTRTSDKSNKREESQCWDFTMKDTECPADQLGECQQIGWKTICWNQMSESSAERTEPAVGIRKRVRLPSLFRKQDVTRAAAGVLASGLPVRQIEIDKDGKIIVVVGVPPTTTAQLQLSEDLETPEKVLGLI
jgi:hypothetical protein